MNIIYYIASHEETFKLSYSNCGIAKYTNHYLITTNITI